MLYCWNAITVFACRSWIFVKKITVLNECARSEAYLKQGYKNHSSLKHAAWCSGVGRIFVWGAAPSFPPFPSPFLPSLRSKPPQFQLGSLGERCKLPQQGLGRSPSRNRIFTSKYDIWRQQFSIIFQRMKWPSLLHFCTQLDALGIF